MSGQPHKSQERILLKRPFADSGVGTPTLCLTKLRVTVGGENDLSWDKTFSEELLLNWHQNIASAKPFIPGSIFA